MAQQETKKNGGGKLSRSETVTVRLNPQLRYLAELAARKQRRTLSSFIEWAIEDSLARVHLDEHDHVNLFEVRNSLWDVDESDRFLKLAFRYPDLLTHEEQVLWKIVKECGLMWIGNWKAADGEFNWEIREENFRYDKLREYWEIFNSVANGESPKSDLPSWNKYKKTGDTNLIKKNVNKISTDDFEDDIPSDWS